MTSETTKEEADEAALSGDFVDPDTETKSPDDIPPVIVLPTDHGESSSIKEIHPRRRILLSVLFALLLLVAGSSLMGILITRKSTRHANSFDAPGDPESPSNTEGAPVDTPSTTNNTQTSPTNETDSDLVAKPALIPESAPVRQPSAALSLSPIRAATRSPLLFPSTGPSSSPTYEDTIIIYAFGDLPYTKADSVGLEAMMDNVPSDADLVIHVGDIRNARGNITCQRSDYEDVRDLFNRSHAPVLLILGDNEWNDCPNVEEGYRHWIRTFVDFEKKWPSSPQLKRWSQYPESFHFVMRGVLFIGLNLVGGRVHDVNEWKTRLEYQYSATRDLILEYWTAYGDAAKVVIIGHCDPAVEHNLFFLPFTSFVNDELENRIPILYLNGDKHVWDLRYDYLGAPGLMRLMVVGGSKEAPARIEINTGDETSDPRLAFAVKRNSYLFRNQRA